MKLKLLFLPRYHANPNTGEKDLPPFYPPLSISTLKSFMKKNQDKHSFKVEQDDLDIKTVRHNMETSEEDKINLKKFFHQGRIYDFLKNEIDPGLEEEAEKIIEMTDLKGYDVVGLSLMPTDNPSTAGVTLAVSKKIKERYDPTIIIGGSIRDGSKTEKKLIGSKYIDYRILGSPSTSAGEYNLLDFCQKYESGNVLETTGLVWNDSGKYKVNHLDYSEELKAKATFPEFEGLPIDLYRRKIEREVDGREMEMELLVIPVFFIRCCPYSCAFCSNSRINAWGHKDPKIVADKLESLKKKYDTKYFFFHNTSINPTYEYAERFADEIIKRDLDIQWSDCANFKPLDKHLLRKLKKAGAGRLVFGFESASPPILKYINKPFTINNAEKVLKAAHELNIWVELDMICGFPYESEKDTEATLQFLKKHKDEIEACYLNKFWVDGLFKETPEKYGIEPRGEAATHTNWAARPYDEKYGLKWKDRKRKTEETFKKIQNMINRNSTPPPHIHEFFLRLNKGEKYNKN